LRERLKATANEIGFSFAAPPLSLCTDNAAMVAWAGIERLRLNMVDDLTAAPRARWPLDPNAAPAIGAGVKA
jgi:N6-L-threonylcarbamoyladenine synthase